METVDRARQALIERAPSVLAGLGILLGGWLVARMIGAALERALRAARLDAAVEGTRLHALLSALGNGWSLSRLLAKLAYVFLLLLTLDTAAGYWGLSGLQSALSSAVAYVPKALSALALFVGGTYLASVAKRSIGAVLRELRNPAAGAIEAVVEGALLLIVALIALNVLGADLTFVTSNLTVLVVALAAVLVFLACWAMRAPAEELVANYYVRRMLSVGDHVQTKTQQGIVLEFVPLGLILRDPTGDEHFVPARELIAGLRRRPALKPDSPQR
jgi:hypothetical protein